MVTRHPLMVSGKVDIFDDHDLDPESQLQLPPSTATANLNDSVNLSADSFPERHQVENPTASSNIDSELAFLRNPT